ncbi:rhodopsin-like [Lineus longissimus]|uniref:rhodopsin-like n=1 Tax=Lineus longissimus TaxID=88925 RepID=UPI002B4CC902
MVTTDVSGTDVTGTDVTTDASWSSDNYTSPYLDNITTEAPWYIFGDLKIHPHWWQYDMTQIPDYHFYIIGIYIGIVGLIGTVGNSVVIYTFFKTKSIQTPPNMLIVNLSASDLIFSAVNGFPLFTIASFNRIWTWGMKTCEVYGAIGGIFGLMSINTNAMIALDRYLVIAQPFEALKRMTKNRAFILIVLVWFWSFIISLMPLAGFGAYIPEGFQTSCTFDYLTQTPSNYAFNIGLYVFGFLIPVLIIFWSYYKIVRAVMIHEDEMARMAQKLGAKDMRQGSDRRSDIKTAKVSATLVLLYLMSWGPYSIVSLAALLGYRSFLNPYMSEIPVIFAKTSAIYNPIVYAVSHPKFRLAMSKQVPWLFICCKPPPSRGLSKSGSMVSERSTSSIMEHGSVRKTKNVSTIEGGPSAAVSTTTLASNLGETEMKDINLSKADTPDEETTSKF